MPTSGITEPGSGLGVVKAAITSGITELGVVTISVTGGIAEPDFVTTCITGRITQAELPCQLIARGVSTSGGVSPSGIPVV